jgi:hypothetical protein
MDSVSFTLHGNMKDGSGGITYCTDTLEEALEFAEQCRDYVITKFSRDETGRDLDSSSRPIGFASVVMTHVAYSESYAKAYVRFSDSESDQDAILEGYSNSGLESFESIMERIMQ